MANYIKLTDFSTKDGLASGDPQKVIKGTEINDEFNDIQTAINSKANVNTPQLTGAPTTPTATAGTMTTQIASCQFVTNAITAGITDTLNAAYPVGSVYINASDSTNPATLMGFGTWVAFGSGKVPVGIDSGDSSFDVAEETGGSKDSIVPLHSHSGSTGLAGAHSHTINANLTANDQNSETVSYHAGGSLETSTAPDHTHSVTVDNAGVDATNGNLQPYIVVHMWKRTA